jgi:polyisoprenoid-binding protein YceI
VTATIELASIDTNNPQRDDDLRSANFFETDTYLAMTSRSTGIRTARTASMSTAS